MKFAQIRIDKEEGSYDEYYNYEFAIVCDQQYSVSPCINLNFFGEARYQCNRDEERETTKDRSHWGIPREEVKLIYEE